MAARLITAGILRFSQPLYDEIRGHLLKVYASMFIPALKAEADNSEANIEQVRQQVGHMRDFVKSLDEDPQNVRAFMGLMSYLMPLMLNGALQQFGIRLDRLEEHLRTGNRRGIDKYLGRVKELIDRMERDTEEGLRERAKHMREDIKEWMPHFDEDFARKLKEDAKAQKAPDLELKLKPEHFPFLGEKFQRHVEQVRGEDAEMFDDMPSMKVKLRQLADPKMMGVWDNANKELIVQVPAFAPYKRVERDLKQALQHELRHMTQTLMARALGISQVRIAESGEIIPQYQASPGMPPRDVLNLDLIQALMREGPSDEELEQLPPEKAKKIRKQFKALEERRKELMQLHKLGSKRSIYNLDDLEFYTHLADRVMQFEELLEAEVTKGWTPKQKRFAFDLFTGAREVPKDVRRHLEQQQLPPDRRKEVEDWLAQNDPHLTVLSVGHRADDYFRHMRKYKRPRWRKAVKEFAKVIQPQIGGQPSTGVKKLWEQFLEERYDGGKDKIRNPNPKTRDKYPEVSISYLMKQDDPAYKTDRQNIRREFAAWRQRRQGPDLFSRPPGS